MIIGEKNKSFKIITLGCPLNQSESDLMRARLHQAGYSETGTGDDTADIYIINSCTVTQNAARKSRKEARKAKKGNPDAWVCLVGCYGEMEYEEIKEKIPEIDLIIGTRNREKAIEKLVGQELDLNQFHNFPQDNNEIRPDKIRPAIKIQEGCDQSCSYCIVTLARGRPKSREFRQIKQQVKSYLEEGYQEIILAGTNMGLYGKDVKGQSKHSYKFIDLPMLVSELATLPYDDYRIRISSLEPLEMTEELLYAMKEHDKICNYLYLPLQSGSDRILKLMNRKYTTDDFARIVEKAKTLLPGVGIMTDLIVGFPGEKEEDHKATMEFVEELKLSKLHVFPYSPRPKTLAASFNVQVRPDIKRARTEEMKELGQKLARRFYQENLNTRLRVLYERNYETSDKILGEGFSENYCLVRFETKGTNLTNKKGEFVNVISHQNYDWGLMGSTSQEVKY
ncbi:tRNA (N(6)-L-threonylcarbamoyladenosine(37)-C(2))-methylthiotransferase MtaB [Natranaerobius thermophilus]|uniref:RNA modification enzyme, MiaB family n=1 Tax=Natranaerobius thermophilus (strain ATCC BAA-1301 / DSM 18059 / JW/NM-WN-LF) TaxID=457570 RepID=B2A5M5_NATTJ|nr:tRNA (N(6)-L-threonylcarbamoyladenosine(37)-C(2))-methylthiotransferase MtaB [Natranaerobius thermophilus]ACB85379.1 RNA modification enzyme, MiaB family [Natranaerobius thermophilus JW/NM-WN-LF]